MKKIFLVRHAKSDWSISGIKDIERPLNQRGYENAHQVGAIMQGKITDTTLFISSPAIRAISTALIFAEETRYKKGKIKIIEELYEAGENVYHQIISDIENSYDTVLIFGHNPTISNVVAILTEREVFDLPTCSVSEIIAETGDWGVFQRVKKRLESQFSPKNPIMK